MVGVDVVLAPDVVLALEVAEVELFALVELDELAFAEVDFVGLAQPLGTLKSWQVLQYIIDCV